GTLPPLLSTLTTTPKQPRPTAINTTNLTHQLAVLSEPEQHHHLLTLVRTHAAAVLGHPTPDAIQDERGFPDIGLTSLTALELRNTLSAVTGLQLPTVVVFDYPTPTALASYLRDRICVDTTTTSAAALIELEKLETALIASSSQSDRERKAIARRLQELARKLNGTEQTPDDMTHKILSASPDEILDFIDSELDNGLAYTAPSNEVPRDGQ